MTTRKGAGAKQPLDQKVARKLLKLLSTDNEFRRRFKRSPSEALASIGHTAVSAATACSSIGAIAPKTEIAASAKELEAYLVSTGALTNPHNFVAGEVAASLKRK
jgi:putative modified peptide